MYRGWDGQLKVTRERIFIKLKSSGPRKQKKKKHIYMHILYMTFNNVLYQIKIIISLR